MSVCNERMPCLNCFTVYFANCLDVLDVHDFGMIFCGQKILNDFCGFADVTERY